MCYTLFQEVIFLKGRSPRVNVSVPLDLYEWLSSEADKHGLSRSGYVVYVLNHYRRSQQQGRGKSFDGSSK